MECFVLYKGPTHRFFNWKEAAALGSCLSRTITKASGACIAAYCLLLITLGSFSSTGKLQSSYNLFLHYDLLIIFLIVGLTEEVTSARVLSDLLSRPSLLSSSNGRFYDIVSSQMLLQYPSHRSLQLVCTSCALLYKLCFVVQVVLCCTNDALLYTLCFVVQVVLCSKALVLTLKSEDEAREVNSFVSENTEINLYFT